MVVLPNFHVGNFKAIFSGDLMDNPFEGDLDPTGKDFVSVFGSPNNVVIKVVDRCSAICKSFCIFHTNDYTIIHVSHIRPSGVKKGGQFITSLKERVSLPLFNRVGDNLLVQVSLSHNTVRIVPYTAYRQHNHNVFHGVSWQYDYIRVITYYYSIAL